MHCSTFAMPLSLLLAILLGGIAHNVHGTCSSMSCTCHILMDYVADQRQCATLHNLDGLVHLRKLR